MECGDGEVLSVDESECLGIVITLPKGRVITMAGLEGKSSHKITSQQSGTTISSTMPTEDYAEAILKELPLELQRWINELGNDYQSHLTKKSLLSDTSRDSNYISKGIRTNMKIKPETKTEMVKLEP